MLDATLVTGTSGLVGYRVAEMLAMAGVDVLGVDVRPPGAGTSFAHMIADATDLDVMSRLMQGRPNIVHAGAVSGPMLMLDDPHGIARANVGGCMAMFEAAYRHRARRLVWLSSIAVYGDQPPRRQIREAFMATQRSSARLYCTDMLRSMVWMRWRCVYRRSSDLVGRPLAHCARSSKLGWTGSR